MKTSGQDHPYSYPYPCPVRIHVTYTGGTIGMVDSPRGLVPGADQESRFDAVLKEAGGSIGSISLTALSPLIDSSNAAPESWQRIIDDLRAGASDADAFVVLHGTDTMTHTCAALSYALTDLDRPVVVTGSQLPLGAVGSDAAPNIAGALHAAASRRARGVSLFFGHRLLAGNRAVKASSWAFDAFDSPAVAPLARAGAPWRWAPAPPRGAGWPDPRPYTRQDAVVIDLVPGITAARLEAMLTPRPDAVILRAFGVGNIPDGEPGLTDVLASAIGAGTAVVVISQCHHGEVRLSRYAAGDALARAGAVGGADMTPEAAYAKAVFLLSQGLRGAELAAWMGRSIAGELDDRPGGA